METSASGTMTATRHGQVGTLIIDNPRRRNAMNAAMYAAVPDAIAQLHSEPDLRVVVLRGAGDAAFGAGSDISEFPERRFGESAGAYDQAEHLAWDAIANMSVPVIAAIHGPCMGGGIALAMHADVRIAADDAVFSVPPARLGLAYPREATERLVELVGPAQAKRLLFTAARIDADEALRIGLVQEVVAKSELDAHVNELTISMCQLAPMSQAAAKLTVDSMSAPDKAQAARELANACYQSRDFREGVAAFMEKRRPSFHGE